MMFFSASHAGAEARVLLASLQDVTQLEPDCWKGRFRDLELTVWLDDDLPHSERVVGIGIKTCISADLGKRVHIWSLSTMRKNRQAQKGIVAKLFGRPPDIYLQPSDLEDAIRTLDPALQSALSWIPLQSGNCLFVSGSSKEESEACVRMLRDKHLVDNVAQVANWCDMLVFDGPLLQVSVEWANTRKPKLIQDHALCRNLYECLYHLAHV